ncbi:MAG: hypothetical protein ACREMY_13600, partial [bacterium]
QAHHVLPVPVRSSRPLLAVWGGVWGSQREAPAWGAAVRASLWGVSRSDGGGEFGTGGGVVGADPPIVGLAASPEFSDSESSVVLMRWVCKTCWFVSPQAMVWLFGSDAHAKICPNHDSCADAGSPLESITEEEYEAERQKMIQELRNQPYPGDNR